MEYFNMNPESINLMPDCDGALVAVVVQYGVLNASFGSAQAMENQQQFELLTL